MSQLAVGTISVRGLGKRYNAGMTHQALPDLRETIMAPFKRGRGQRHTSAERSWFWALRDVSFDVRPGEVVGVIGSNGAGKSTLLKILSRIVEPTTGRLEMAGRIGCLLEVGTGFHRELTGRENIFLNGAILGMSRRETQAKFDQIVEFSGIEPFIDAPVKHYSSGMYLRLGFAVAAHIEPEILIIDEVLTVGDAAFQTKCIGRVGELVNEGRTVLIVSHQLPIIQKLCSRAILIRKGEVVLDGDVQDVAEGYLGDSNYQSGEDLGNRQDRRGSGRVRLQRIGLVGIGEAGLVAGGAASFEFETTSGSCPIQCSFTIYDSLGDGVTSFDMANPSIADTPVRDGCRIFRCEIPSLPLRPGRYRLNAALHSYGGEMEDHIEGALAFEVLPGLVNGRATAAYPGYGRVEFPHRWVAL